MLKDEVTFFIDEYERIHKIETQLGIDAPK